MSADMMGGAAPADADFSKMSIEERLASKLWKARVSAYEDLTKAFPKTSSENDPIFRQYTRNPDILKSIVVDTNAVAQEKGVDAVRAFVEFGGQPAGKTREVVVPALVEKCLGSARAGTKKNALDLISFYAEMEDLVGCEPLLADLLEGLKAKQPKVVAGCITAIKDLVRDFGHKQVAPKPILKRLPDMFAHSDKNVRAEASLLALELHKYIGAALEPTIDTLKDIQAKELRQQFADIDAQLSSKPAPTRFLLSQREKLQAAAAAPPAHSDANGAAAPDAHADSAAAEADQDDDVDPYDLAEPVNVFGSRDYPADFEDMIVSKKWQERKETLETVLKILTSSPKIQPDGRFDNLVDHLALKINKDANINVVLVSCQCLEAMAKGLRDNFSRYKDKVVPPIIEKLKEKKPATVEVLAKALDAIFQTVAFSDVLEPIFTGIKHKNPAVKTESIRFLVRCLRTTRVAPAKADIKPIAEALVSAMADGSPDVRDAGAAGLGTLMKLIGERPMNVFLDGLDDIKKGKVQDEFKTAEVRVKMGGGGGGAAAAAGAGARRPPAAAAPAPAASNRAAPAAVVRAKPPSAAASMADGKENQAPRPVARPPAGMAARPIGARPAAAASAASSSAPARKPAAASSSAASGARSGAAAASGGKAAASATEPVKYRFHPDDAESRAAELIPDGIATQLASSNWKERLAGMSEFNDWLKVEAESVEAEIIVRALGKKPGWKESNFQVMAEVYKALQLLANDCPTFGRPSIALSVQPLCDKLGDIKLKTPAGETLVLFAEKTSFGFLLAQALGPLASLKAPKAIADSILWVDQTLLEFGTAGVDVRSLIDYLVNCLKSANAAVRTNATKAIGTLARFLGTTLNAFVADLNPQLRTTIEGEIEKAASNPPPAPVRFGDETKAPSSKAAAGSAAAAGAGAPAQDNGVDEDMLDELVPRVDLDRLVPATAIARMGDANWKERKEGLEEVLGVVNANSRLKGNMAELANALKTRCSDSNIMCKSMALDAIAKIATGMNKHFEPQARILAPAIAQVLADAKAPVRAAATTALTAIANQVGAAPLLPGFGTVLDSKAANPMLKQELFGWLAEWFEAHPPEKGMDLAPLALPCVQCLDDKLAAVRKASIACLPYIVMRAGYKHVLEQANQLKTASKNTAVPLIDAAKAQAQTLARSAAAPAAPAAAAAPAAPVSAATSRVAAASARTGAASPARPLGASSVAAASASPRASTIARPGGIKPPSAVGRSLKAPSSTIARQSRLASDATDSGSAARNASGSAAGASGSGAGSGNAVDRSAPLIASDIKAKALREKREGKGASWIGADGAPRPELVEVLRQQCEGQLSRGITDSMFSKSHSAEKDFYAALTLLSDFISSPTFAEEQYGLSPEETMERTLANSDLIFKYVSIRLTDNNTSLSLKCLDILEHLVAMLSTQQYHMSDYEAVCILPCLTAKLATPRWLPRPHPRDLPQDDLHLPAEQAAHVLPRERPAVQECTRPRRVSGRGRLPVFQERAASVLAIADTAGDRQADQRPRCQRAHCGALGARRGVQDHRRRGVQAGGIPSGQGNVDARGETQANHGTLDGWSGSWCSTAADGQRHARAGPRASVIPSAGTSSPTRASAGRRPRDSRDPARCCHLQQELQQVQGVGCPRLARLVLAQHAASQQWGCRVLHEPRPGYRHRERRCFGRLAMALAVPPACWHRNATSWWATRCPPRGRRADGGPSDQPGREQQRRAERACAQARRGVHREEEPQLILHVDQLAIVLSKQMQRAFAADAGEFGHERLKKHLLVVSTSLFDKNRVWEEGRTLGSYLSRSALIPLLTVLLQQLIQSTSRSDDAAAQNESKFLNVIVLRCFSACNLNLLYGACLQMLTEATEDLRELEGEVLETRSKFSELLVKCLWKIAKRLEESLAQGQVEPQQLFADVESFLQAIAPSEWRQRAQDGVPLADLPLRTVKIILSHTRTTLARRRWACST